MRLQYPAFPGHQKEQEWRWALNPVQSDPEVRAPSNKGCFLSLLLLCPLFHTSNRDASKSVMSEMISLLLAFGSGPMGGPHWLLPPSEYQAGNT